MQFLLYNSLTGTDSSKLTYEKADITWSSLPNYDWILIILLHRLELFNDEPPKKLKCNYWAECKTLPLQKSIHGDKLLFHPKFFELLAFLLERRPPKFGSYFQDRTDCSHQRPAIAATAVASPVVKLRRNLATKAHVQRLLLCWLNIDSGN